MYTLVFRLGSIWLGTAVNQTNLQLLRYCYSQISNPPSLPPLLEIRFLMSFLFWFLSMIAQSCRTKNPSNQSGWRILSTSQAHISFHLCLKCHTACQSSRNANNLVKCLLLKTHENNPNKSNTMYIIFQDYEY